ncbi:GMC family oxidoreductase N-terminal domain-containing protein [Streptomyces sp. NPDC007189]|uniref:GMC family oxidoreductase n=1 Tax=Streptomyces sp. NPDC007189 TaxID=3154315 RepID=UPI003455042A
MAHLTGYDYVVVGGGTAGSVVAARLSEDAAARVLLIEAGSAAVRAGMRTPQAWMSLLGSSADWNDVSVAQAATGASYPLPRGRGIGGSSSINGMAFLRGHRSSYDAWVRAGAPGWGYEDVLPFFRRSESTQGRDPSVRGVNGPMLVAPASRPHPISVAGVEAAVEAGHARAVDPSGGLEVGAGLHDLNIVAGQRQSAADAYLRPVLRRPNLDVVTDAFVHRLRMVRDRCVGLCYSQGKEQVTVDCSREVVLTAGAIGSPHLLMLSGIGPAKHLRDVGVDVVADLPGVGSHFQDHPQTSIVYSAAAPIPVSHNNHGEASVLLGSELTSRPDLQALFVTLPYHSPALKGPAEGYSIVVSLMAPRSRGWVRLASREPDVAPLVNPTYLQDHRDVEALVLGLQRAREIGEARALSAWRGSEVLPGPGFRDASALRRHVRESLTTYFHYAGTCRIGSDEKSVVDDRLRVHGVTGLRVADASVMPSIVSANTNAAVLAIAERAADFMSTGSHTQ